MTSSLLSEPLVVNTLIGGAVAIFLAVLAKFFGRKNSSYDQIQQDLAGQRNDALNLRNEMEWLRECVSITEGDYDKLREAARDAGINVPQRQPKPSRPTPIKLDGAA